MAEFTIKIEGDELDELQEIVASIRKEQPGVTITEQGYIENLVLGRLRERMKAAYIGHMQKKNLPELKSTLGTLKEIRRGISNDA